ncbi:hypothetical protein LBMAG42_37390 [Deltaproteobacteria bacterium]|nr:hypothetical protein LBMAG42_37390 [Deltaproteobacteria bacterium]
MAISWEFAVLLLAAGCAAEDEADIVAEGDPCEEKGETVDCEGGDEGAFRVCLSHASDEPTWGECDEWECRPDEHQSGGTCTIDSSGVPVWRADSPDTPLLLRFRPGRTEYRPNPAEFALGPRCSITDWPAAETPWLALDVDRDGVIGSARELFGNATRLPNGETAHNGFEALTALDANGDGEVDAVDPAFARLLLWSDANADKRSEPSELVSLGSHGVVALSTAYVDRPVCDERGNCAREASTFQMVNPAGTVQRGDLVDVHLPCRAVSIAQREVLDLGTYVEWAATP